MPSLKTILKQIGKELKEKGKTREEALENVRKVASLAKQTILLIHQKKLKESKKLIEKTKEAIAKIDESAKVYPELVYGGAVSAALQEYSEANILLTLVEESRFVTPQEINVPSNDYVLGLADVIGEYRRLALDALREGNLKKGEEGLQIMDEIYIELMAMDEAYMLIPGLRRKCDIARRIIEATRGDITQEVRRSTLERHLKRFEKLAKTGSKFIE